MRFQKKVGVVKGYFLKNFQDDQIQKGKKKKKKKKKKKEEIFLGKIVMIPEKGCWELVVIAA